MSRPVIWLISEDETDAEVIRAILKVKQIDIQIKPLHPRPGGITRLAKQLETFIKAVQVQKGKQDCIAVLHDADENIEPNRIPYNTIADVCKRYQVKQVVARDELEAWILADEGFCRWVGRKPQNCDGLMRPSDTLKSLVDKKLGKKYQAVDRQKVLAQLDGTGDKKSPSMREAVQFLQPCISLETEADTAL